MGEMIKFGIKIGLTVATAVALMAAIAIVFGLITSNLPVTAGSQAFYYVRDTFKLVSLFLPFNVFLVFTVITALFAFKVAYWAADKMLWLIDVLG